MSSTADISTVSGAGHQAEARWWSARELIEERWLREFIERLWRHKWLLVTTVGLVTLAAFVHVAQVTPRYAAKAKILIGVPKANVVDIQNVLRGLPVNRAHIESEMQVLTSRSLAAKVVDRLDLVNDPEFNPRLRPPSHSPLRRWLPGIGLDPLGWIPERWRAALSGAGSADPPPPPTPEEIEQRARRAAIARIQGTVMASIEGRSHVIAITARSPSPKLAAELVNNLADLYLLEQLEAKFEATRRANDWLNDRVRDLRRQVEASERAVEEYRREHDLIEGKDTTVTEQQISEINTQLILARTKTAEAGARLRQIRSLLKSERGVESAAEVLASSLIQSLRERESDVTRRAAEVATEYGPRHPKMINVKAELEDVRERLGKEVEKIVHGLDNELEVARIREQTLARNLESLKAEAVKLNASSGRLRVLEREAAANRTLFDTFLSRWKETGRQEEIQHADARILSYAEVPTRPVSPKKRRIVGAALGFSVFLGILLVYLIEQLDSGFRSSEQIESATGLGTLALIPLLTGLRLRRRQPAAYALDRPASSFAEALRTLHTGILLSNVDAPPKSILITSSLPDEGKTAISSAIARLLARSGRKVLLIDADLRRGQIAKVLGLPNEHGLVEVLGRRQHSLDEVVQHDEASGLHVLTTGGTLVPNPSDLLGSDRMRALLWEAGGIYDLIVIDSPPVHLVSDTRILSHMVDKTVFAVRWTRTRREVAALGVRQLVESGAGVAGVVLSMVDVRKNARYSYADSGYYYGSSRKYRKYYAD